MENLHLLSCRERLRIVNKLTQKKSTYIEEFLNSNLLICFHSIRHVFIYLHKTWRILGAKVKLLDWWWLYYERWFSLENLERSFFGSFQNIEAFLSDLRHSKSKKRWFQSWNVIFLYLGNAIACARPPRLILQLSGILSYSLRFQLKSRI